MAFEVKIPSMGESVTEAVIGRWIKQDGDAVQADEPLLELESDKANMELAAEHAGVLRIVKKEGETVQVGELVATIEPAKAGRAAASKATAATPAPAPTPRATPAPAAAAAATASGTTSPRAAAGAAAPVAAAEPAPLSPAVQRIVTEERLDVSGAAGSGRGGRLTKGDVLEMKRQQSAVAPAQPPAPAPAPTPAPAARTAATEAERRVPMSRLRQVIARRLVEAQHTAAILTTFNEVDMSAVLELRARYKDAFQKKHGIGLGFLSFFARACAEALAEVPEINAEIQGTDVVYRDALHLGVAVGTDRGLIVPVVRHVERLSFAGIEAEVARLAGLARDGKLTPDDLAGATFTISNGGVYGSLLSTPILSPPQSGILGMHKIEKRPIVVDDQIVIRPMMYLALSYDHRIVDGKGAVTFLVRVKERLEDPSRLLLAV